MEDGILPSSSQDIADSSPREPRRDSWASVNHPHADIDREEAEESEEWEQIMWPLRPMACTSPLLSFATVQWDVPDPTAETSFVVTDGNMDDEVSAGSSSPPLLHDQEERDDGWRIDLQLLHSVLQRTGSDSEVGWVCDVKSFQIWTLCPVSVVLPCTTAGTCLKKGSKRGNECGENKSHDHLSEPH